MKKLLGILNIWSMNFKVLTIANYHPTTFKLPKKRILNKEEKTNRKKVSEKNLRNVRLHQPILPITALKSRMMKTKISRADGLYSLKKSRSYIQNQRSKRLILSKNIIIEETNGANKQLPTPKSRSEQPISISSRSKSVNLRKRQKTLMEWILIAVAKKAMTSLLRLCQPNQGKWLRSSRFVKQERLESIATND